MPPCDIIGLSAGIFTFDSVPVGSADIEKVGPQPSTKGLGNVGDDPHGEGGEQEVEVGLDSGGNHRRNRPKLRTNEETDSFTKS